MMEKMLKVPLGLMAVVLSVFLVAGTAGAAQCPAIFDGPEDCGCVAMSDVTFGADVTCSTRHGIIIGASGITIDGAGYKLDGGGVTNRHCAVLTEAHDGDPTSQWCVNHPCRAAADTACRSGANEGDCCIDSGILNARGTDGDGNLAGGCNSDAPACQGGCSNVIIKNLEITGWCDGIFVSGDCSPTERRLTDLVIEGCCIHDNGKDPTCCYEPATTAEGGDYRCGDRYYNDAIFTAQVGLDEDNTGDLWKKISGLPLERHIMPRCGNIYTQWWKLPCGCWDPEGETWITKCECTGPNWGISPNCNKLCENCECKFFWPDQVSHNIIAHNRIYNQKGCGVVSCAGGNGINLQGGLEIENVIWSGANEIAKNVIKNCARSGIQYTHATKSNRIHGNYIIGCGFGGITDPCNWCHDNYIFDNWLYGNRGMGIGVAARAEIENNFCLDSTAVPDECGKRLIGYPWEGYGIIIGGDAGDSKIYNNTCVGNAEADIADNSGTAIGDANMCKDTISYCDTNAYTGTTCCTSATSCDGGCRYMAGERLNCRADLDHDCKVYITDISIFAGEFLHGLDPNKPPCCPAGFEVHP